MLSKELFIKYIESHKRFETSIKELSTILTGDEYNIFDAKFPREEATMLDLFIKSHFTIAGCDLVYWWMYEPTVKIIYINKLDLFPDEKELKVDVTDIEDLWDYMVKNKEDYFVL